MNLIYKARTIKIMHKKLLTFYQLFVYKILVVVHASNVEKALPCTLHSPQETGFIKDGDLMISGLFPVHTAWIDTKYLFTERNPPLTCSSFSTVLYSYVQAMVYAIEEINANDSLLPNISLGYKIFDSCMHLFQSLRGTLWALTGQDHPILNYECHPNVPIAIIGDATSGTSVAMATLLGVYRYPQVSYSASMSSFSNHFLYPSFFRTIPNDAMQSLALAHLISYMGWTWVGLISLDDDYGIDGSHVLKQELYKLAVCIAYHESFGIESSSKRIQSVANIIDQSSARVVIIYSRDPFVSMLMEYFVERQDTKRIWLATTGWSNSQMLPTKLFSHTVMGTLGLSLHQAEMPWLKKFLLNIHPSTSLPYDIFIKTFWEMVHNCQWPEEYSVVTNGTVWCTGEEKLLRFKSSVYEFDEFDFRVYHHLRKVSFVNRMGEQMYFDQHGDPPAYFDIVNWQRSQDGTIQFLKVGWYDARAPLGKEIVINTTAIQWITGDTEVPPSVCSESCAPGYRKAAEKGQPICCFDCIRCSEGEISNQTDSSNCFPCTAETWPNEDRTECLPKPVDFLSFEEPLGITITCTTIFSSFSTLTILCVFIRYKDTAIVKANNRDLTYVLLGSLSLSFLCPLLFIGQPHRFTCLFRQVTFGVIFVLSVSCVLAKTVMVVIAFRATKPGSNMRRWLGPIVPGLIVSACTNLQLFICIFWMLYCPPFPERNSRIKIGVIVFQCNECSDTLLWCMVGCMAFLSCVCFLVAFLARKLPDTFNEAKWITFSMLIFLSVWIAFAPAYLSTQGKNMAAVEVFGIICSSAGILVCIFLPKCYIILLRPDLNTRGNILNNRSTYNT
ncbi:hypothetical protein XENTR_v10010224 [Xenopus tropicalis]|nr:hypothetical protein XENTR_v10010224 [Xenopus tropicalis]